MSGRGVFFAFEGETGVLRSVRQQLTESADAAYGSRPPTLRILIVDDYRPFAQSLSVMLQPMHEVRIAGSGADALRIAQTERFDTAFVDLKLPDMTGVELCAALHAKAIHFPRGVVVITGGGGDPTMWSELARMDVKFIEKPFTADQLFALLRP